MRFHSLIGRFLDEAGSFCRKESGMTLPLIAISFMAMIGFVGTSVDLAREQLIQSRLLFSLDAAGLAAGSTMNTANIEAEVAKYMGANFPAGYLGAAIPTISVQVSADKAVITLTANTTVDPVFMQVFGVNTLSISASSQITRIATGLELAMVLDNTGSMGGSSLASLKSAANNLVDILYGGKATAKNLWIGLVPFSHTVNIGTSRTNWLDADYNNANYPTSAWGPTTWAGCVDAREAYGMDVTDDAPAAVYNATTAKTFFRQYFWPSKCGSWNYSHTYCNWASNAWKSPENNLTTYSSPLNTLDQGPNYDCPQPITAMTSNKTTILNAINAMTAQGATHINLGLVWGWHMLSPTWKAAWSSSETHEGEALPLAYGKAHMNKAVVLLSDGENTMYSGDIRTAYGYLSENRLGTTNADTAIGKLNTRLTTVCNSMKSKGIYVYTIALNNPGTTVQTLLKNCATADNYYFNSPTAADLRNIFSAIADSLSNLRVSK
ncbi:MAG: pilus assembly protein [Alphaproteobacteria bacterium]|nr:pilus assembly protein [Alphaproteobacteria bacterium]